MSKDTQTSFLGGMWSPRSQGVLDDPDYKKALAECLNAFPTQEGQWVRRPGLFEAGMTRNGAPGKLLELSLTAAPSHNFEVTDGHVRIWKSGQLVVDPGVQTITAISTGKPAVVSTGTAHGWADDDHVYISLAAADPAHYADINAVANREFTIQVVDTTHVALYLYDGRPLNGSSINFSTANALMFIGKVTDLSVPYASGDYANTNIVETDKNAVLLNNYAPLEILLENGDQPFGIREAEFIDGPYLDPLVGITASVDRKTGIVDVTFSYTDFIATKAYNEGDFVGVPGSSYGYRSLVNGNVGNNPTLAASAAFWTPITSLNGFANNGAGLTSADIGRHIRLFSEPPNWLPNTNYIKGQNVSFGTGDTRTYYSALAAITGVADVDGVTNPNQPGYDSTKWVPVPQAARWTWGKIVEPVPLTVTIPGVWQAPGFVLTSQCPPTSSYNFPQLQAIPNYLKKVTNITSDQLVEMGFDPATFPAGGIWVTPPIATGFGGGCGPFAAVGQNQVMGYDGLTGVGFGPAAADAGGFIIAQFINNSLGSAEYIPWQFWSRSSGSPNAPTQPQFVTTVPSADALDGVPGKAIGNMTRGSGVAKLFTQNTPQTYWASADGNDGWAGLRLQTPGVISQARVYPVQRTQNKGDNDHDDHSQDVEYGFATPGGTTLGVNIKLWGKTGGSDPADASDGVLLGDVHVKGPFTSGAPIVIPSGDLKTVYTHGWVEIIADFYTPWGITRSNTMPVAPPDVAASKVSIYSDYKIPAGTSIGVQLEGDDLLYTGTVYTWRLGRYNNHMPTWPRAGCFANGRLVLFTDDNHFDASSQFGLFNFTPTYPDGVVTDGHAISEDLLVLGKNKILWGIEDEEGFLLGSGSGEYLITGSQKTSPTPLDIKSEPVGGYGSANVAPVRTPLTTVFAHKNGRELHELMRDAWSGQLVAPTMSNKSLSLTEGGVTKMAYQHGLTPIVWSRTGLNTLVGTTYRRDHHFSWQPPAFNGWHRHEHGAGRAVMSLATNNALSGNTDTIMALTKDDRGFYHVEILDDLMEDNDNVFDNNFLDAAVVPMGAHFGNTGVTLYGLSAHEGRRVTVFMGGLDCGDWDVADGKVTVTYGGDLTYRYLEELEANGYGQNHMAVNIDGVARVPILVGYSYRSAGQKLRFIEGDDGKPALGVIRRAHKVALLLHNTAGLNIGTDFDKLLPLSARDAGGTPLSATELATGLYIATIEDDSSPDGQFAWEITRPFSANISAIEVELVLTAFGGA